MMSERKVKGEFLWKIENFSNCGNCKGKAIISPVFTLVTQFDTDWRLFLYPRGKSNESYVSCYLDYHEDNTVRIRSANFEISILTKDGKIHKTCKGRSALVRSGRRFGFDQFCPRQTIFDTKDTVLPKDTLSICCHLTVEIENDDQEGKGCDATLEELSQNFRTLFQSGEFSDMTLSASGEAYQVHRVFIWARAQNLAKELGVSEHMNPQEVVKLNHVSSPVLMALLQYLYSGQIETADPDVLAGLYEVARRYDLRRLKRHLFPGSAQSSARTRIKVVRKTFLWCIDDFSKRSMNQGFPIHKFVDMGIIRVVLTCCVAQSADCVQVYVRRVRPWMTQKIYFRCRISVKGALTKAASQECERWFDKSNSESQFPILSLKRKLMLENLVYLPKDELQIAVEFSASDGQQRSRIENRQCLWTSAIEEKMKYLSLYQLREDLKSIWNSVDFTDLLVKAEDGEELKAHKAIIATRSPVFSSILREGSSDGNFQLNLSDLNLGIASELLKYLYRGEVHAYTFEEYVKLYAAAVKYEVLSLNKRCVNYLVTHVTSENVCELLILSDKFEDEVLLISAQEYISANRHVILNSDEWKRLIKEQPQLGSKLLLWLSTQILSKQ